MKPKFELQNFCPSTGDFCMHCDTLEKAEIFTGYLESQGKTFKSGALYSSNPQWSTYKSNTVYYFNRGTFGYIDDRDSTTMVLEFDDFLFDEDCTQEVVIKYEELFQNGGDVCEI